MGSRGVMRYEAVGIWNKTENENADTAESEE
jgi:hypothetical protein